MTPTGAKDSSSVVRFAMFSTLLLCFRKSRSFSVSRYQTCYRQDHAIRLFSTSTDPIIVPTLAPFDGSSGRPQVPKKFVDFPFQYHEEVTMRIETITNRGLGLGRVEIDETGEDDKKWVVMVPHVNVGELTRVRIFRNHKSYSEADLMQVLESSADRVEPKCELAGVCGGCQYQHMDINVQRKLKQDHVMEWLLAENIEGYNTSDTLAPLMQPTSGTEHEFGYRSKLTPHYNAPREVAESQFEMEAIGFQKCSNRQLVDVPHCPIATDAINDVYRQTRIDLYEQARQGLLNSKTNPLKKPKKKKKRGSRNADTGATLLFREADPLPGTTDPVVVTDPNEYMTTTVKGIKFRYLAGNFFQNNNHVIPLMVDAVLHAARQPTANGEPPKFLIDCYCGSGLFALSAAPCFQDCIGIEVNERAIEEASYNAESNGISNAQFVAASAEAIFTSPQRLAGSNMTVADLPRDDTVVVVDPPRKGCSEEFLDQLYSYSPQRIVYMSCDPSTQARDAKGIIERGGYTITSIEPFDLFPQTKHVECLVVFEKRQETSS